MPTTTTTTPLGGGANGSSTNPVDPLVGKQIGQESSLSNWAGPYVTDMLGKGWALSEQPYQQYQGPLTAGASDLQQKAFQGIAGLTVPSAMGTAANTAGQVANAAKGMNYDPNQFQTGMFDSNAAQAYMNPYLQNALNPQIDGCVSIRNLLDAINCGFELVVE